MRKVLRSGDEARSSVFGGKYVPNHLSWLWLLTLTLVAVDLWQTRGGNVTIKKAAIWSIVWFLLAFVFAISLYYGWQWYALTAATVPRKPLFLLLPAICSKSR